MSENINGPITYHEFRKRFLESVQRHGFQFHSLQVRGLSPQGRPLFTDVAYSVFNPSLPTLVHISGVHGIEGYIGSAIQTEILEKLKLNDYENVNIIFIHSMNPWGMAWYRRVNGQNIDLNRNYFPEGVERPENIEFNDFQPLFEKKVKNKYRKYLRTLLKYGVARIGDIVAKGQFQHPDSLFYGGSNNVFEVTEPFRFLNKIIKNDKQVCFIDVHSGLGKFASDNWILDENHSEEEFKFWSSLNPKNIWSPRLTKNLYSSYGNLRAAALDILRNKNIFYCYLEFGTFHPVKVLSCLIQENKDFLKLILNRERSFQMISHFFPSQRRWRERCKSKGVEVYFDVLNKLSSSPRKPSP